MSQEEDLLLALGGSVVVHSQAFEKIHQFGDLVQKWNPAINIVAKSTVSEIWQRHMLDSAQIFRKLPEEARIWADLGSGGGFPGLVVAILAQSLKPELKVTLVEADKRKAVFLREAARKLELSVTIEAERIERLAPLQANVVSARALAPLSQLCDLAHRHMAAGGVAILLKGKRSDAEIATARQKWAFELEVTDSITSAEASVLKLKELRLA